MNGMIFQELRVHDQPVIETPEENMAGPWYAVRAPGAHEWGILKNTWIANELRLLGEKRGKQRARACFQLDTVVPGHSPEEPTPVTLELNTELVRGQGPWLYCLFAVTNLTSLTLEARFFLVFDFDVGGFDRHGTDYGSFETLRLTPGPGVPVTSKAAATGIPVSVARQWDASGLHVGFACPQVVNYHEVFRPADFRLDAKDPRLEGHVAPGPADLGVALGWNIGQLATGSTWSVPVILFAGDNPSRVSQTIQRALDRVPDLHARFRRVIERCLREDETGRESRQVDGIGGF